MKPSAVFAQHRDTIRRIVLESGMTNPRLFGSVLHGDDTNSSDIDIVVDAPPRISLFDLARLEGRLEDTLGIHVDIRLPEELHRRFREEVLAAATPL